MWPHQQVVAEEPLLDQLLFSQFRAAKRLDRVAQSLTLVAWFVLGFFVLGGLIVGVLVAVLDQRPVFLLIIPLYWIGAFLIFLQLYLAPTWARACAAKLFVDVERQWSA